MRQTDRKTYDRKVNSRERIVLQALFAGLEGRELTTAWADFIAIHKDPAPIALNTEFSRCPPHCDKAKALTVLGHSDKIAEFLKRTRDFSRIRDSDLAEQMVNLEVDGVEVDGP
ncbi:MAG: hypothetical protein HP497_10565 [Nitrospira sp.]|nr:hypothetical protein [Nitrospira sp.]